MGCLRCGKETENNAVFCKECTVEMADCPIKPGTVVVIPQREPAHPEKKSRRKAKENREVMKKADRKRKKSASKRTANKLSPTEQDNKQLRRIARFLFVVALVLLGMVCFLAYLLFSK